MIAEEEETDIESWWGGWLGGRLDGGPARWMVDPTVLKSRLNL